MYTNYGIRIQNLYPFIIFIPVLFLRIWNQKAAWWFRIYVDSGAMIQIDSTVTIQNLCPDNGVTIQNLNPDGDIDDSDPIVALNSQSENIRFLSLSL